MSGIGDYIHLKNSNYKRYGTTYKGPSDFDSASALFQAQRTAMLNKINSSSNQSTAGLEKFLNGLLYGNEGNIPGYKEEAWSRFQNLVEEIFHEQFGQFDFNMAQGIQAYSNLKGISNKRKILRRDEIQKYLDRIVQMLQGNISVKKEAPIAELEKIKNQLQNYLDTHSEDIRVSTEDGQMLVANINKAISFQSLPRNPATGAAAEIFFAAASVSANEKAEDVGDELLKKMISSSVVGDLRSHATIEGSHFDERYVDLKEAVPQGWQQIDENNRFQVSMASQDKTDIIFEWNDTNLAVSAKNYSLRQEDQMVHILSGSNLLYLISNEEPVMINHWLNLISTSNRDDDSSGPLLQQAHETIKLCILIKALTGQGLGRKGVADTFLLNNRSQRHIYIYTMKQLANNCIKVFNDIQFSGYPNNGLSHFYEGEAPSEDSARIRITNLLKSVGNCKISVALPQSAFY